MPCYAAGAGQEDSLGGGAGRSPPDCARPAQQLPDRAAPTQHCRSGCMFQVQGKIFCPHPCGACHAQIILLTYSCYK